MPLARRYVPEHATFTTLLMSTGLTFGTISSLYGLQAGIIDQTQFSLLVTVVVLSAIVPTAIAQRWFSPDVELETAARRSRAEAPRRRGRRRSPSRRRAGMTPYVFENVLVAIDGSEGAQRALDCAISLVERLGGKLTALAVEGKLPAYAATAGEVDEVKQEKDAFFQRCSRARELRPRSTASSSRPTWSRATRPR